VNSVLATFALYTVVSSCSQMCNGVVCKNVVLFQQRCASIEWVSSWFK